MPSEPAVKRALAFIDYLNEVNTPSRTIVFSVRYMSRKNRLQSVYPQLFVPWESLTALAACRMDFPFRV
jgi:hypothetical protein